MNFSTFGPFKVSDPSWETVSLFYKSVREANPQLEDAIGVYVVAIREADHALLPCYVGRTFHGFGGRFKQHFVQKSLLS